VETGEFLFDDPGLKDKETKSKELKQFAERLYAIWPRQEHKKEATDAIERAVKKKVVGAEQLEKYFRQYAGSEKVAELKRVKAATKKDFIPLCATWVNNQRWTDLQNMKPRGKTFEEMAEESRREAERARANGADDGLRA